MSTRAQQIIQRQKDFASRLALMKVEAGRLGLIRTSHAFSHPVEPIPHGSPGEIAGPLEVVGYEMADILNGKQVPAPGEPRRKTKRS